MMEKVRLAIVGCGAAGKIQARAMRACPLVELHRVADVDARPAEALGVGCSVPWTIEVEALMDDPSIEAVSIATPHHTHLALAARAIAAGKHVLLEKPFTTRVQDGRKLADAARAAGVVLAPWLERRFMPQAELARQVVAEGRLGKIVYTRASALGYKPRAYWEYGMRFEEYPSSWRATRQTSGGGVLLMNAIHQVDLMRFVTGLDVAEVHGRVATLHHEVEVEDTATASLRYTTGALGTIEASCAAFGVGQFPIEEPPDLVAGTDGHLQLGVALQTYDRHRFSERHELPRLRVADMKARALEDFARHLREGTPLRCTAADALAALAVVEAAYRSAQCGSPVPLDAG
jgi:predicted dehydrogenase